MSTVDGIARITVTRAGVSFNLATARDTIECYLETKDLDLGKGQQFVLFQAMLCEITNQQFNSNMGVVFSYKNAPQEAWTDLSKISLAQATEPVFFDLPEARIWKIKFHDEKALARWKFTRFQLLGEILGMGL